MAKIHRYIMKSFKKQSCLNVHLIGMTIATGIQDINTLQRLAK